MKMEEHMQLWVQASIKLLDIRHISMRHGEQLAAYRLPANGYLYAVRGAATIWLDGVEYGVKNMFALHFGKSMILDIQLDLEHFEYYLLLYKASFPVHAISKLRDDEKELSLHVQYGHVPLHPLSLYDKLELLTSEWRLQGELERLHVKSLFYQFVYELMLQLVEQNVRMIPADPAEQAEKYLREHYMEPVTVELLAKLLDCSPSHLSRLFKQRTACSPVEYMIRLRIEQAQKLLAHTEAKLQEIASSIGYSDVYYFSRIFKKQVGLSPLRYREKSRSLAGEQHSPFLMLESSIVPSKLRRYINKRSDNRYQYKGEGEFPLIRNRRQSAALTLLLCLTLMLTACSGAANSSGATSGNNISESAPSVSNSNSVQQDTATVTYTGADGEVQVPKNPQRIIVLTHAYAGYFMALGVTPVGAPTKTKENPYFKGKIDGMEDIGEWGSFSMEKIVTLNPDLIVALKGTDQLEEMGKIAPVVTVNYGEKNYKEQLLDFGKLTNRVEQAEKWIADWEDQIANYKTQVLEAVGDKTVSVQGQSGKEIYIYGKGYGRGTEILYDEFGLKGPPAFDIDLGYMEISLEKLPDYAGDYIFTTLDLEEHSDISPIYESSLWLNLPAVQNDNVFHMDKSTAAFNDPPTLQAMLPIVVNNLLDAAGKNK